MSQYILVYSLSVLVAVLCVCVYSKRIIVYVTCIVVDKLVCTHCNIVCCKQLFTFLFLEVDSQATARSLNLRLAKTVVLLLMDMTFK